MSMKALRIFGQTILPKKTSFSTRTNIKERKDISVKAKAVVLGAVVMLLLLTVVVVRGCGEKDAASPTGVNPTLAANANDKRRAALGFEDLKSLHFLHFSSENGLPCDEVSAIHQDREGFMWIGSKYGLFQYDGFNIKVFKNTTSRPRMLTSNSITCLADDEENIWIGTDRGLNRMNKRTGRIRQYLFNEYNNCNVCDKLLLTHDGQLWLGTDGGLYLYEASRDTFVFHSNERGNTIVPHVSVKSLTEDSRGYIWVGTWNKGLFRYDPQENFWYQMPKFNDGNSAQVAYVDKASRLWVGTWGHGLYRIDNPYGTDEPLDFVCFHTEGAEGQLQSNFIYSIIEEEGSGTLWVGNRRGLAILPKNAETSTRLICYPQYDEPSQRGMAGGVSSLFIDHSGLIWMHTQSEGVLYTRLSKKHFSNISVTDLMPFGKTDDIRYADWDGDDGIIVSLSDYGLIHWKPNSEVENITAKVTGRADVCVNTTLASGDRLFIGTLRHGLFINDGEAIQNFNTDNSPWLTDNCIYSLCESNGVLLLGTYSGLCLLKEGKGTKIEKIDSVDIGNVKVTHILPVKGGYYLSTKGHGLIFVDECFKKITVYRQAFTLAGEAVGFVGVQQALLDHKGRIWIASHDKGLMLYDGKLDRLLCMNRRFEIPDENVNNLAEDRQGHLWLSTNYGLVRISVDDNCALTDMRIYTTNDGLSSNYYSNGGVSYLENGRIAFYNNHSIASFQPSSIRINTSPSVAAVTGVSVFNHPIDGLDDGRVDALPPFTRKLVLDAEQNDITVAFSTFI